MFVTCHATAIFGVTDFSAQDPSSALSLPHNIFSLVHQLDDMTLWRALQVDETPGVAALCTKGSPSSAPFTKCSAYNYTD